ncbi:hypothetical protein BBJ28_00020134 [Nothophytophthora sp. Chile5]|nr:hypothetical protein BBJ28_00020134 [Nothophytophthora sp. Chile5]
MTPPPANHPPLAATTLHDHSPSSPALIIVRLVCRECLPISGGSLPHVAHLLDAFLDEFSDTLTLSRGYLLSDGSLRLLQYPAAHERPTVDPILRRWAFNDVVGCAAAKGDLETLQWLLESYLPDEFLTKAVAEAASGGHLHVLEWLWANYRSRGYWGATKMGRANFEVNTHQALDLAAGKGQWDVAIWIVENCEMKAHPEEPYDELFGRATGDGSLEFLKLVTRRKLWTPNSATASEMISSAAAAGHLETVKWLHEELGINSAGDGYFLAAIGGHLEVLKYLHEKHLHNDSTLSLMDAAARNGFLDVMQWLHANFNQKCTTNAMDCAATIGRLDVVQWLHEHRSEGCASAATDLAASNGHMDIVKWLHSHRSEGCKWATLGWAAEFGHLDMMQWLHNNRHEWPEKLNSTFVAPTSLILSGSAAVKSEVVQSLTAAGEEDAELESRFGVMDELKRVMSTRRGPDHPGVETDQAQDAGDGFRIV